MKHIALTNSERVAVVDDEDYKRVTGLDTAWFIDPDGYVAATRRAAVSPVVLHRFILGVDDGRLVHHKNGNHLDNRRANLVIISTELKSHRRRKKRNATSRFCGVCRGTGKRAQYWQAGITINGKRRALGWFKDEADAARAYDKAAYQRFGPLANLNFPEEYPDNPDSIAHIGPDERSRQRGKR